MKVYYNLLAGLFTILILKSSIIFAQENKEEAPQLPVIIKTTAHANFDYKEGSYKDWLDNEKEYFDKVTSKNEYLLGTNVLQHMYTEDNSEVLFIRVCKNWGDIEKAAIRDGELAKEAWPDIEERTTFFKNQAKYYTNLHSDEIYQAIEGGKYMDDSERNTAHVYYTRISHMEYPEDSEPGELQKLYKEYVENVTHKNPLVLAYYPYTHLYGADSREFVEVFVVKELADIEMASNKIGELVEAHWPDEENRKEFFQKYSKYFSGWHADYIYQNVPELMK